MTLSVPPSCGAPVSVHAPCAGGAPFRTRSPVALIHGWGFGPMIWARIAERLSPGFDVHLAALPGYASSNPGGADFEEAARRLACELPEGTLLCGWSLGGLLALKAALEFPSRFSGLVLVGVSPCFTRKKDWPHAQPPELLESFAERVKKDAAGTLQRFNALLNQGDIHAKDASRALARAQAAAAIPDTASLLRGLEWLRDTDLRPEITALSLPIRLVHGDRDPLMPLSAAQWMEARLQNARLTCVHGAAHAPFLHAPESIVHSIDELAHCAHATSAFRETARS